MFILLEQAPSVETEAFEQKIRASPRDATGARDRDKPRLSLEILDAAILKTFSKI